MGISAALGSSALLPAGLGFRNKVINGDMRINQRGASITSGGFAVDRWLTGWSHTATFTASQSTTAADGFTNAHLTTIGTGSATVDATTANVQHRIEGYNVADCGFGTAWAKQMTLSFWVRSSITGTYCVTFRNAAINRYYIAEYTINVANTWEYKTIQFVADSTGTWEKTTSAGLHILWQLAKMSTTAAAGAWQTTAAVSSNQTHLVGTSGATFYLTGVQLEQNYQPTPFEQRPYGVELALCQRYYWRSKANSAYGQVASGAFTSTVNCAIVIQPPVSLRTAPSTSGIDYSNIAVGDNNVVPLVPSAIAINHSSTTAWTFDCTVTGATQYRPAFMQANNNSAGYIGVSVEL